MTTTRRTFFGTILAALGLAKAAPAKPGPSFGLRWLRDHNTAMISGLDEVCAKWRESIVQELKTRPLTARQLWILQEWREGRITDPWTIGKEFDIPMFSVPKRMDAATRR